MVSVMKQINFTINNNQILSNNIVMTYSIENEVAVLICQSDDIAKQVRLENWDTVELLTRERQESLEQFFKQPVAAKHAGIVEKMIRTILSNDHEIINFIEIEKKNTFNKFAKLKNNNKAKQTYNNIASLNYS